MPGRPAPTVAGAASGASRVVSIAAADLRAVLDARPGVLVIDGAGVGGVPLMAEPLGRADGVAERVRVVEATPLGDRAVPVRAEVYQRAPRRTSAGYASVLVSERGVHAEFERDGQRYVLAPFGPTGAAQGGAGDAAHIAHVLYASDPGASGVPGCGTARVVGLDDPAVSGSSVSGPADGGHAPPVSPTLAASAALLADIGRAFEGAAGGAGAIDSLEVRLALEADYETFQAFGSADAATAWMLHTVAAASAIFRRDTGTRLAVPFVRVWTTPDDPYTGLSTDLLAELVRYGNDVETPSGRTLMHLFTARRTVGFGGIAFLDVLDTPTMGYGITAYVTPTADRTAMFAHEIGHNIGAPHTHSCLWPDGPLDLCAPVEGDCHAGPVVRSEGTIMSYCQARMELGPVVAAYARSRADVAPRVPSYVRLPTAPADSVALDALYDALGGATWTRREGWTRGPAHARAGVALRNGRVLALDLSNNGLDGALPDGVGALDALRDLRLPGNRVGGVLPVAIGRWTHLETLDLGGNRIGGPVPPEVGLLARLRTLSLGGNRLTGPLPVEMERLTSLRTLALSGNVIGGNAIGGGVPSVLARLTGLRNLALSSTGLSGPFPAGFGALRHLETLSLGGNALTGAVPADLGTLARLTALDLSGNRFEGSVPDLRALVRLGSVDLGRNRFTGEIPAWLGRAGLHAVSLGANRLTGPLPPDLGRALHLGLLDVADNPGLSGPLPTSLVALSRLSTFRYGGTALCEPHETSFQAWLAAVRTRSGTGVACTAVDVPPEDLRGADGAMPPSPNPASGRVRLSFAVASPVAVRVSLHDLLGRTLAVRFDGPALPGQTHSVEIDVSGLAAGVYTVTVVRAGRAVEAWKRVVAR